MAGQYRAMDGDRIDSIVYKYYGTLETALEKVIAANPHLNAILTVGDVVYPPEVEIKAKEAKLW